jgi:para-nitrobenzyl esterase
MKMKKNFINGFLLIGAMLFLACNGTPSRNDESSGIDPDFHIYIAIGQSNMQGPGAIEAQDLDHVTDRFRILNVIADTYGGEARARSEWYTASPPLILPGAVNQVNYLGINIGLSPVNNFGWTLTQSPQVPANVKIGVIAVAHGDLGLASFSRNNAIVQAYHDGAASSTVKQGIKRYSDVYAPGQYNGMYQAVLQNALLAREVGVLKGIILHQGESNIANSGTVAGYTWGSMLKEIYDDLHTDLGLPANTLPLIAGQLYGGSGPASTGGAGPGGALANDASLRTATGLTNVYVISSSGLSGRQNLQGQYDYTHFSAAGIRGLGQNFADKMIELVY